MATKAPPSRDASRVSTSRAAFTLIGLLVVIAVIGVLVALLLPAVELGATEIAGSGPNIRLMLIDDLGRADLGFHGGNAEFTPHRARLAEQSVHVYGLVGRHDKTDFNR